MQYDLRKYRRNKGGPSAAPFMVLGRPYFLPWLVRGDQGFCRGRSGGTDFGGDQLSYDMPTLSYVLQGVQRAQACSGSNKPRPRLPITAAVMRLLKHAWEAQGPSFNCTMLWAISCTCFFGFLRSGEATVPSQGAFDPSVHLSISDVALDSPTSPKTVILRIKASKTDPWGKTYTWADSDVPSSRSPRLYTFPRHRRRSVIQVRGRHPAD